MNWDAVAAAAEIVGAIAVVITLAYLARQVRQANRQDLLGAFQHNYDSTNQFLQSTLTSGDLADIVVQGRDSYESLSPSERLRFDHFHLVVLNIVESHLFQVARTADGLERDYASWARENMKVVIQGYFGFPGTRTLWMQLEPYFEPSVRVFVNAALADAAGGGAVLETRS